MIAMKRAQQNETDVFIQMHPQRNSASDSFGASECFVELWNDPNGAKIRRI
jgi:hypothetical protein